MLPKRGGLRGHHKRWEYILPLVFQGLDAGMDLAFAIHEAARNSGVSVAALRRRLASCKKCRESLANEYGYWHL